MSASALLIASVSFMGLPFGCGLRNPQSMPTGNPTIRGECANA